jgi:hypothetical protein
MMVVIVAAAALSARAATAAPAVPQVAGTWLIEGTIEESDCDFPGSPFEEEATFTNIGSVARDGTVVNVDPAGGTQVGEAYRLPGNRYAIGFFGLLATGFGPTLLEVRGIGELINPGELTGTFTSYLTTVGGQPICSYSGSLNGSRLVPSAM